MLVSSKKGTPYRPEYTKILVMKILRNVHVFAGNLHIHLMDYDFT